jgi:SAM-dependent methyltransferase
MTSPMTPEAVAARVNPREYELRTLEVGEDLPRYTEWLLEDFRPYLRGRVIEVGAGIGTIARRYINQVDESVLVEPATVLCERLQRDLAGKKNVHPLHGTLQDVFGKTVASPSGDVDVSEGTFDVAIMVNVLEHIPEDEEVLRLLFRLLKPGGTLLIFVPAIPFLYGALDARVGHVRRYTRRTLSRVVEGAGFAMKKLRYFDLLGMVPWFVTGRLLRQETVGSGSAKFYDQYIVPLCALIDNVTKPEMGKNLICVAEKSSAA